MLDMASSYEENVWDQDEFIAMVCSRGVAQSAQAFMEADTDLHDMLRLNTDGKAKEIVDTHDKQGCHVWWELHRRFMAKLYRVLQVNVQDYLHSRRNRKKRRSI